MENSANTPKRRTIGRRKLLLGGAAGVAAAGSVALGFTFANSASAAESGNGLKIVDHNEDDPRMHFFRFATEEIEWDPAVNVLLPDGYHDSGKRYPVLYMLHGGNGNFMSFDKENKIRDLTAGKEIILVMPDAATGWYSNPVSTNSGPRNWETFHMKQLMPWIDANFRTIADASGRAVGGFSMGGFGALKYAAKYYGDFSSVSAHSGPPSLRRDAGLVVHWANATSAALELGGGTVYGVPWDEKRVDADNPMQNLDKYQGKRIFMVAGNSPEPLNLFDQANEREVLAGQQEFRSALDKAGIKHEAHEEQGGHLLRPKLFDADLNGMIEHLRSAG